MASNAEVFIIILEDSWKRVKEKSNLFDKIMLLEIIISYLNILLKNLFINIFITLFFASNFIMNIIQINFFAQFLFNCTKILIFRII